MHIIFSKGRARYTIQITTSKLIFISVYVNTDRLLCRSFCKCSTTYSRPTIRTTVTSVDISEWQNIWYNICTYLYYTNWYRLLLVDVPTRMPSTLSSQLYLFAFVKCLASSQWPMDAWAAVVDRQIGGWMDVWMLNVASVGKTCSCSFVRHTIQRLERVKIQKIMSES